MMRAICQICGEDYAYVDVVPFEEADGNTGRKKEIQALRYPVTGAMFGSADAYHGVPAPFDPTLTFEFMRCPYGRIHRPMIQDDLVKTYKGMVRLPKDGSKAFMDASVTGDVDRDRIGDQTQQVPDDVAEKIARGSLMVESKEPIPPLHLYEVKIDPEQSGWICVTCGKQFDKQKSLQGHMMSHKKKPQPSAKKMVAKKKGKKR